MPSRAQTCSSQVFVWGLNKKKTLAPCQSMATTPVSLKRMYSLQSSSQRVRSHRSGRSSLSHRIFGTTSLAVGMLPVCS